MLTFQFVLMRSHKICESSSKINLWMINVNGMSYYYLKEFYSTGKEVKEIYILRSYNFLFLQNCIQWMNSITKMKWNFFFIFNKITNNCYIFFKHTTLWEMESSYYFIWNLLLNTNIYIRFSILLTKYHTHTSSLSPKGIWKCKSVVYWISIKIKNKKIRKKNHT